MILLSGHSLTPARKVPAEAMSLQLRERDSTASITPVDMAGISTESWFQDDTNPGKNIVWRVKGIQTAYGTDTQTVQLEHIINTLKDKILFGEHTAAQITGNPDATSCTAEQAVRYILRFQSDWRLGAFGYSTSNPYKFDGDTLFDALERVTNSLEDPWWSFDTSQYPFVLNIQPRQAGTMCALRPGRNLNTITKTIEKNGMFTRAYPIGKDDLHITGEYVSKNENTYGVIEKPMTDTSLETEEELRAWAASEVSRHCEPTVTITVDAVELAEATGESFDRFHLGRICTIPLTEFDTTINERITELSYPDKIHEPEVVKITLCNNRTDVTRIIADALKESARGGRGGARQQKEDHAWIEDTEDHVAMCAIGIIGKDAQGNPNWVRLSRLQVDENGIFGEVQEVKNDVVIANTKITQNERQITLEAQARLAGDNSLSSRITVNASQISAEVTRAKGAEGTLSGRITVNANKVAVVVDDSYNLKTASIVAGINAQTGSYVKIEADNIDLTGYVTATQLSATQADIDNLKAGTTTASHLKAYSMSADHLTVNSGGSFTVSSYNASWKLLQYKDHSGTDKEIYVLGR